MSNTNDVLNDMTQRLLAFRRERDWEQFHHPKDQILSLVLEANELLELTQWREGDALDRHLEDRKEDVADELSDVLGWVLLIAYDRGVDLRAAVEAKMRKNEAKYPVEKAKGRATKYRDQ